MPQPSHLARPTVLPLEDRATPDAQPLGTVGGVVFMDVDGDGVRDTGENGLAGVVVTLDANGDGTTDGLTTTTADGSYSFAAVPDGNHKVTATPPVGYGATTANPVIVAVSKGAVVPPAADSKAPATPVVNPLDVGLKPNSGVGGRVALGDADSKLGQPGLSGVALSLVSKSADVATRVATTNADGYYFFDNVANGEYTVFVNAPAGSKVLNTPLGGSGWPVTVNSGIVGDKDFGVTYPSSVTGRLFLDLDGDGTRDEGERAVAPGTVRVRLGGTGTPIVVPATANDDGTFTLAGLPDGTHTLLVRPPGGLGLDDGDLTVTIANGTAAIGDVAVRPVGGSAVAVGDTNGGGATVYEFTSTDGKLVATPGKAVGAGNGSANGTRVVLADLNGDGTDDLVTASGRGVAPLVRVYDGATQAELVAGGFMAFEKTFVGGVNLAAGDFNGDGKADLVITADTGGGARVRVLDGAKLLAGKSATEAVLSDFMGIEDANFRGGARAAVGDLDGDGVVDLVVAAGAGGGPRVAVFDGASVAGGTPTRKVDDFFVFESQLRNGAVVGVGDVNGDGKADLIASAGPGGAPRVAILTGDEILAGKAADSWRVADFFVGGDTRSRAGARVTVKDVDRDGMADVIATSGGKAFVFTGKVLTASPTSPTDGGILTPYPSNGLFVG